MSSESPHENLLFRHLILDTHSESLRHRANEETNEGEEDANHNLEG